MEIIRDYWELGVAVIVLIGWFFRLEAKVLYLEKNHERVELSVWAKLDALQVTMAELTKAIYRVEGKLETKEQN